MTEPVLGVLLISVWSHGGVPVARLRGYRGIHGVPSEYGVVAGTGDILGSVAEWLCSVGFPIGEPPQLDVPVTNE
ncbi:MAG: hypothetical protein AUI14_18265 [Actinobacteria bacterium 13_2_20CM_2_71_6]|nr:MAG: hypothetical protein AUI14_18265 [Actinobacteria bacterium 13_2_20CM_2_71_6]